ncbi:MAG: hypothetical protein KA116_02105 [Proteobacteria bacterium]|nr:hypothetical protein [Pseudomonadota bacterium]
MNRKFFKLLIVKLQLSIILLAWGERPNSEALQQIKSLKKLSTLSFPKEISAYHPQGLVKVEDHFFLTTVDKDGQRGFIYKFHINDKTIVFDAQKDLTLSDGQYHPGGIDFDSQSGELVTAVAQYKANSISTLIRINPNTLEFREISKINDHIGTLFIANKSSQIIGFNWDAIGSYQLEVNNDPLKNPQANPKSSDKAYQDCKSINGGTCAIATGLRKEGFGKNGYLCLIKCDDNGKIEEFFNIFTQKVDKDGNLAGSFDFSAKPLAQNPIEVETISDESGKSKIIFYFVPFDKDESSLMIFEGIN